MSKKPVGIKVTSAHDVLTHLFGNFVLFEKQADGEVPIPYHWVPGESNLVVITGDNAAGKSVVRRLVSQVYRDAEIDPIPISMQSRTAGGMQSAFVYGDEGWESTGQISARTVVTGIKTCRGRQKPHMIFWDEPDLGLSDSWAAGVGVAFAEFARTLPALTKGAFVVTHSKALLSQVIGVPHHFVHLGDGPHPADLAAWCARPIEPLSIETLGDRSHTRFKRIQAALDANKPDKP